MEVIMKMKTGYWQYYYLRGTLRSEGRYASDQKQVNGNTIIKLFKRER